MFGMMIDIGPKYYGVPSPSLYMTLRSRSRTFFMLKFYVKDFRTSLFPNPMMDLVHVWFDDRYWSKSFWGTIPTHIHDFKVKVRDSEFHVKFYVKVFSTPIFPNPVMDFIHVWYDDR